MNNAQQPNGEKKMTMFKVTATKNGKKTECNDVEKWDLADLMERYCALGYNVNVELS